MAATTVFTERPRLIERLRESRNAYQAIAADNDERDGIRRNAAEMVASFERSILRLESLGDDPAPPLDRKEFRV